MVLTIGSESAIVNDSEIKLDSPAISSKNTTLVPLRFVSEQFGLDVYWDAPTKSVHLYQKSQSVDPPASVPNDGGNSSTQPATGTGTQPGRNRFRRYAE